MNASKHFDIKGDPRRARRFFRSIATRAEQLGKSAKTDVKTFVRANRKQARKFHKPAYCRRYSLWMERGDAMRRTCGLTISNLVKVV